jgi:hypothetical protein
MELPYFGMTNYILIGHCPHMCPQGRKEMPQKSNCVGEREKEKEKKSSGGI